MTAKTRGRVRPSPPDDVELEMTPMIDVTFLILVFFMCTLRFKSLEGQLSAYLPEDVGVNPATADQVEDLDLGLHLRAAGTKVDPEGRPWSATGGGRWSYAADRRVDYSLGPARGLDLEALRGRLGGLEDSRSITLAPGEGVVQQEVVEVLDVLLTAGHERVRIRGAAGD